MPQCFFLFERIDITPDHQRKHYESKTEQKKYEQRCVHRPPPQAFGDQTTLTRFSLHNNQRC